jgi:hypothetical protein
MKKQFVLFLVFFFATSIFANVRMDSMLLQNGELKDMMGDYLYSPTFFPEQNMIIYFGNGDNTYINENTVFTETNNWRNNDILKTTDNNYLFNFLFLKKMKNIVFGLNYKPILQGYKNDVITKRYSKIMSIYLTNEEDINSIDLFSHELNLSGAMNMEKFNVGIRMGMIYGKEETKYNFYDILDSSNDIDDDLLDKSFNFILSPDILFKLSFGKILASFNIQSISVQSDENYNDGGGNSYFINYKETGTNFMPKLFFSNMFSFGIIRFGLTFGSESLKRKYGYSEPEFTWEYSNKTSGVTSFITLTKEYKHSLITGGFRILSTKNTELYKYDPDTTNATTFQDHTNTNNASGFTLILAFEQQLNDFMTFFGGVNWNASNNLTSNTLVKDETGAMISNDTDKLQTPSFDYGLGISFKIWSIGSLNFSISNIAQGFGNLDDNIDELALNNINTSNEKCFTFYFDFLR